MVSKLFGFEQIPHYNQVVKAFLRERQSFLNFYEKEPEENKSMKNEISEEKSPKKRKKKGSPKKKQKKEEIEGEEPEAEEPEIEEPYNNILSV